MEASDRKLTLARAGLFPVLLAGLLLGKGLVDNVAVPGGVGAGHGTA